MFLIHKVASRRTSRDHIAGQSIEAVNETPTKMDCSYLYNPMPDYQPKKTDKRRSKGKSGLFGGRASLDDMSAEKRLESRGSMVDKETIISFAKKKKLRKAASKSSFAPVAEENSTDIPKSPLLRRMPDSWKGRSRTSSLASATSSARDCKISQPFNFFHISHANQRDLSELSQANQTELARDWVRVSSMQLLRKGQTTPPLRPQKKQSSFGLRSRFLSRHQSTTFSEFDPTPSASEESFSYYAPLSPPPWSPSTETSAAESDSGELVCHAITTPDSSAYGEKSPGIERLLKDHLEAGTKTPEPPEEPERSCTPDAPIPGIRETLATPEQENARESRRFTKRLSVRIRPISQFSDFNADFIVPGSPLLAPISNRMSKRLSAQIQKYQNALGADDFTLDESWEEDIDYSYEHGAESRCDFEWEKSSTYAASIYCEEEPTVEPEQVPESEESSQGNFLTVPDQKKEHAERRITGQFEAHLLLPGSAGSDTVSVAGQESANFENGIILRAARSSLSHRSIESIRSTRSSASLSKVISRNCRDELARVAEHLEDHIAFLNAELGNSRDSLRPPSQMTASSGRRLTRSRTDSDATCVTLCSDAETVTPTDTAEVITPPNSNHNSVTFTHTQFGEIRTAKGLSFPASTIPGVIEFSPEIHDLPVPEDEFVPFI